MGARLGHVAVFVLLLVGGCSSGFDVPADQPADQPAERPTASLHVATSIPEPTPSAEPYSAADVVVRQVAEAFVRGALEYDATAEKQPAFLVRVAPITTSAELDRLRRSPRAHLDWRALRSRTERVTVAVTGISVSATGRVLVEAERTTATSFATVREFIQVSLDLVPDGDTLKVARAEGSGL